MVKFLIHRPIAVTMSLIAIVVLGLLAINLIPVSLMPDIQIPQVTVQVDAPNLSARELDAQIIKPLRLQLQQVPHLKDIHAEARDGSAMVFMQFEHGADIDYVFIEVNERIDRAMGSLPRDVDRPRVMKASATDIPAFYLNLTLKEDTGEDSPYMRQQLLELSRFAMSVIARRFEQLPHVAMVDISGQVLSEMAVIPDMAKLEALGITPARLESAINSNNMGLRNLIIRDGQYQYSIRFSSSLNDKHKIEEVYLSIDGRLYQIKDLATVEERQQQRQGIDRSDGKMAITMAIIKQSDSRMGDLKKNVAELIEAMERDYPYVDFTVTRDQTELLTYSIDNLGQNLLVGIALACLVIFFFMQDFRSPTLVTVTIPLSLIVAVLGLYAVGISINIISLSGLVLGVGMMVDNSIIIIDNISQRWDRGETLEEATVRGTNEVISPLLSSVLTTCAVFVPLIFMSGITGALFYDQAMGVAIGLLASLFVAIFVIPVYYYAVYRKSNKRTENRFLKKLDVINYEAIYEKGLKWTFRHQGIVWAMVIGMLAGAVVLAVVIDKDKLPEMTQDDMLLNIDWNQHVNADENDRRVCTLMSELTSLLDQYTVMAGKQQFILSHTRDNTVSEAVVYMKAVSPKALAEVKELIGPFMTANYPDALFYMERSGNIFDMIFSDNESRLVARIRPVDGKSPDPNKLNLLLEEIRGNLPELYIEPAVWQEVVQLQTRPQIMAVYNVTPSEAYNRMRQALNEYTIFTVREGQYSIPVRLGEKAEVLSDIFETTTLVSRDSVMIPLSTLFTQGREKDLKNLISGPEGEFYPLNLDPADRDVVAVTRKISEVVARDPSFEVSYSGTYFSNREMIKELTLILIIAFLLLYFILASQFESMVQPFIILSELGADMFGALFLLWICGSSLNLMSMIGLIVMCGIVINDSILKVDTINRLRKDGYRLKRAIMTAGNRRLKPIIMTSLTTILAIAPFLFSGGMGADLQYPLSLAIIGGMSVGTVVSVFFIPLAYYYIYRRQDKRNAAK